MSAGTSAEIGLDVERGTRSLRAAGLCGGYQVIWVRSKELGSGK